MKYVFSCGLYVFFYTVNIILGGKGAEIVVFGKTNEK